MQKSKRGSDHTESLNKRQKACISGSFLPLDSTFEEQFGSLYNSGQGVWSILSKEVASNLSRSVVSLALFDGNTMLFACTGIAIARKPHKTRFMTSACLVRAFNDERNSNDNLRIEVRLPNNETVEGYLGLYDQDIAVVTAMSLLKVRPVHLDHQVQFGPHSTVAAAGYAFNSGRLMATSGLLIDGSSGPDREQLKMSTCVITKVAVGGPLIDVDGNFVGMNLYHDKEKTWFLPGSLILQHLGQFQKFSAGNKQRGNCTMKKHTDEIQKTSTPCNSYLAGSSSGETKNSSQQASLPSESIPGVSRVVPSGYMAHFKWLDSMDYPKPSLDMIRCCGTLLNSFEEDFGDIHTWKGAKVYLRGSGEVIWSELDKNVVTNIRRSVVSLGSFNGNVRFFACTGLLINCYGCTRILTSASLVRTSDDENKIDDNLRIEVFLPPNQRSSGTLHCYDLSYNIAIVSVKGFRAVRPANILDQVPSESSKVVAIGRLFNEGILMATGGEVTANLSRFDCKDLMISTCKIKKAGLGGPLIDVYGSFVGMNFYDKKETPFLPRSKILEVLAHFHETGALSGVFAGTASAELTGDCKLNRWPVPKPYWYHRRFDKRYSARHRPQPRMVLQ